MRGDEKSEAQAFLDHFFRALGHDAVIEIGATFEFRVAKKPGSPQLELIKGNGAPARSKGGKRFADLLWPDRVQIEMKSRGENPDKLRSEGRLLDTRSSEAAAVCDPMCARITFVTAASASRWENVFIWSSRGYK